MKYADLKTAVSLIEQYQDELKLCQEIIEAINSHGKELSMKIYADYNDRDGEHDVNLKLPDFILTASFRASIRQTLLNRIYVLESSIRDIENTIH